jgi:hypothetical protein
MPEWAPRRGERCGVLSFCNIGIGNEPALPLCKVHAQRLIIAADAEGLARSWDRSRDS